MSYLRFLLFVIGITVAIGASAKISPRTLERLVPSEPPPPQVDDGELKAEEAPEVPAPGEAEPAELWPDTFPFFVLGIAMAASGVVLWYWELRQERWRLHPAQTVDEGSAAPQSRESPSYTPPLQPLIDRIVWLEQFSLEAEKLRGWEIMRRVDEFLETSLLPVVERRQEIMNQYGTSRGAEILIAVAYGERMMNRTWSAAADGHLPEARSCLPEALEGFHEVQKLAKAGQEEF
jgi:hypothetical protein